MPRRCFDAADVAAVFATLPRHAAAIHAVSVSLRHEMRVANTSQRLCAFAMRAPRYARSAPMRASMMLYARRREQHADA